MRFSFDDSKIILYLNDNTDFDIQDTLSIKQYFKNIFIKLKNEYELNINGLYLVTIYKDINNLVIEIENEKSDIYEYLIDEIDMHIIIENCSFLYELEDIFINLNRINKYKIIKYNNKIYLDVKEHITDMDLSYLKEMSKLIYKNTKNIIKYGEEISLK